LRDQGNLHATRSFLVCGPRIPIFAYLHFQHSCHSSSHCEPVKCCDLPRISFWKGRHVLLHDSLPNRVSSRDGKKAPAGFGDFRDPPPRLQACSISSVCDLMSTRSTNNSFLSPRPSKPPAQTSTGTTPPRLSCGAFPRYLTSTRGIKSRKSRVRSVVQVGQHQLLPKIDGDNPSLDGTKQMGCLTS
jgi:hypothetical protein